MNTPATLADIDTLRTENKKLKDELVLLCAGMRQDIEEIRETVVDALLELLRVSDKVEE